MSATQSTETALAAGGASPPGGAEREADPGAQPGGIEQDAVHIAHRAQLAVMHR